MRTLYYLREIKSFKKMNFSDLTSKKDKITSLLKEQKLHNSFKAIKELIADSESWELQDEITRIETSYKYMIQFFIAGSDDPQRKRIYNEIVDALYTLTDKVIYTLSRNDSSEQYYITKRLLPKFATNFDSAFSNYMAAKAQYDLYAEVPTNRLDNNELIRLARVLEDAETALFNYIWTAFPMSATETAKLASIMTTENDVSSHLRILIVAAIYLNTAKFYQEQLITLLLSLYTSSSDHSVKVSALCCALILIQKYDDRASSSLNIQNAILSLRDDDNFCKDARTIFFILTRSRDTERLNKKVQNELMPEILKISPDVIKRFKAGAQFINDLTEFESNPEWQNILDDSGLTKKIEELNEIQMEGGDVFMGTFAKLKSFSFFSKISNWFIPFHKSHSVPLSVFSEKDILLKDIITNACFLCNSDKYSFCLSLQSVPATQREMMLSQFDAQNSAIQEIKMANLPDPSKKHENIANKFIQDLFRFSKLYSHKTEFYDPFNADRDFLAIDMLRPVLCAKESLMLLGEYFLKNEHYNEAINCFTILTENFDNDLPTIVQKIGFCHQCLKEYDAALESYMKYDLFNPGDLWNLRHIATCYKALHDTAKALEYYRKAECLSPENISVCLNIGHCLLEMGSIEDALKAYFKVDYLDNKKYRAIRPIAWCTFLLGNYKQSHEYYGKVLDNAPSAQDYLNMGHLSVCEHHYSDAIDLYLKSLENYNNDFNIFLHNFNNDRTILEDKGLSALDINLIIDKLRYSLDLPK